MAKLFGPRWNVLAIAMFVVVLETKNLACRARTYIACGSSVLLDGTVQTQTYKTARSKDIPA